MAKIHMNVPGNTPHIEIHRDSGGGGDGCFILVLLVIVFLLIACFWDVIVAFFTWLFIILFWLGVTTLAIWGLYWLIKVIIFYNTNNKGV